MTESTRAGLTVGVVGVGTMGRPMAAHLVRAGHTVRAFVRRDAVREQVLAFGGEPVTALDAVAADADVVVTVLPDTPDVLAVVLGEGGLLPAMRPGSLLIDMSTVRPEGARQLHEAGGAAGVRVLDAPVSGGEAGAVEGTLSIMVGGAEDDFEAARPVLSAMGTTIVRVGGAGAGQVVKAANQLVVAGNIQLLAEALVFLRAHDADCEAAFDVLAGGLAGSTVLERKRQALLTGDHTPGFRVELHDKDLGIVLDAARALRIGLPVTAVVAQFMSALRAQGQGALDHSALAALAAGLNAPAAPRG